MSGVLANQQADPLCSICKAFTNSARKIREDADEFKRMHNAEIATLPAELARLLSGAKETLTGLNPSEDAVGQKKEGNCKMPKGVCFVKSSKAMLEKISGVI